MIVGISGKMQSGKDTVALMWQYIADCDYIHRTTINVDDYKDWCKHKDGLKSNWQIKYFAGKLREFVSSITGLTIEQLMDDIIKSTVLPSFNKTPRQLLQLIGTEVCRAIDPDFHIIALMNDYKGQVATMWRDDYKFNHKGWPTEEDEIKGGYIGMLYPNWLIPDTRFPNELKAIEDRKGSVIRVERSWENRYPGITNKYLERPDLYLKHNHPSETSLDDHEFNYVINNNGTLEDLLKEVQRVYNELQ